MFGYVRYCIRSIVCCPILLLYLSQQVPLSHYVLQMDSGSSNGDDMEDQKLERRGLEQCVAGYKENDKILVWYGKGKTLRTYEAKILGIEENESQRDYLVHYNGWNTR